MNNPSSTSLPEPIARYVDFANRFDAAGAASCFAPDAVVRDEQREYVGLPAIEAWVRHTSEAYRPQVEVTRFAADGEHVTMSGRVEGNFPGSPADLEYRVLLRHGRIAALTVG